MVCRTTDGGVTWQGVSNIPSRHPRCSFRGFGGGLGRAAKDILHTTDGGATWSIQHTPASRDDIYFIDANKGWAVGNNYVALHTVMVG